MVYLFLLSSCMIVMYNVFVILCLEKRGKFFVCTLVLQYLCVLPYFCAFFSL